MMKPELRMEMFSILGELADAEPGYGVPVILNMGSLTREAVRLLREIGALSGHGSDDAMITLRATSTTRN